TTNTIGSRHASGSSSRCSHSCLVFSASAHSAEDSSAFGACAMNWPDALVVVTKTRLVPAALAVAVSARSQSHFMARETSVGGRRLIQQNRAVAGNGDGGEFIERLALVAHAAKERAEVLLEKIRPLQQLARHRQAADASGVGVELEPAL